MLHTRGCRSFVFPLFVDHLMVVPYKPRQHRVDRKSPRQQLSPIPVSLATSSTKKRRRRSYLTGQSTGVFTLGGVMGLDVHQICASNDSLHPPLPPPFPPPLLRLHSLCLSTPPTTAPWTPFPHFFPPPPSSSSSASSVPSLFFLSEPTPLKKVKMAEER